MCFYVCKTGIKIKVEPQKHECKRHLLLGMFLFNVAMVSETDLMVCMLYKQWMSVAIKYKSPVHIQPPTVVKPLWTSGQQCELINLQQ